MPWPQDGVGEGIMFSCCQSAAFVIRPYYYYHDISWMAWAISMKFTVVPIDDMVIDFGGQRSDVKVTAGRRDGKGIDVDARASKSIFYIVLIIGSIPVGYKPVFRIVSK